MATQSSWAPHYPLREVHALVRGGRGLWVGTTRALNPIMAQFGCDRRHAIVFARRIVLSLTEDDFVETVMLCDGTPADVYGLELSGGSWYVKFMITPQTSARDDLLEVDLVSCHPPLHDLRTRRGIIPADTE